MVFVFIFCLLNYREYPCDHYTSVINVTVLMTGCPRVDVHTIAVQLLQVLDKRFFGNVGPLQTEGEKGKTPFFVAVFFFLSMPQIDIFFIRVLRKLLLSRTNHTHFHNIVY